MDAERLEGEESAVAFHVRVIRPEGRKADQTLAFGQQEEAVVRDGNAHKEAGILSSVRMLAREGMPRFTQAFAAWQTEQQNLQIRAVTSARRVRGDRERGNPRRSDAPRTWTLRAFEAVVGKSAGGRTPRALRNRRRFVAPRGRRKEPPTSFKEKGREVLSGLARDASGNGCRSAVRSSGAARAVPYLRTLAETQTAQSFSPASRRECARSERSRCKSSFQ